MNDEDLARYAMLIEDRILASASPDLREELDDMDREVKEFAINVQRLLTSDRPEPHIEYVRLHADRAAYASFHRRKILAKLAERLPPAPMTPATDGEADDRR